MVPKQELVGLVILSAIAVALRVAVGLQCGCVRVIGQVGSGLGGKEEYFIIVWNSPESGDIASLSLKAWGAAQKGRRASENSFFVRPRAASAFELAWLAVPPGLLYPGGHGMSMSFSDLISGSKGCHDGTSLCDCPARLWPRAAVHWSCESLCRRRLQR